MASRSHTVVLVALVEDILAGRKLHAEVALDSSRLTIPEFLAAFSASDLTEVRTALALPVTATSAEIAAAYERRRRAPMVDQARPYLDETAIETRTGPVLLARIATALRYGGPIAGRVSIVEDRGARTLALRDVLDGMRNNRFDRAEQAARTLGLDAVRLGDVAGVIAGRLEQAGLLPKAKPRPKHAALHG